MKTTLTSLMSLGFVGALVVGFVNCGGTGGEPFFGNTAVNQSCNPDSSCLDLSTPTGAVTVGDEGPYSVDLRNGDGSPSPGIQICCGCPDAGCSVTDPSGGCGQTASNGHLSGTFSCNQDGSHEFECQAPSGFGLEVANTIKCAAVECTPPADPDATPGTGCQGNQFCPESGGPCGFPDETCIALRRLGECCEGDAQCIGDATCRGGTCEACVEAGGTCADDLDCCSGLSCSGGDDPVCT